MAIAILNPRYKHLRGAIGNIVVKHYGDKVVLTRKPVFRNRTFSPAQKECQERFREAALLANRLMADPRVRRVYDREARARGKPARSLIIGDLLHFRFEAHGQTRPNHKTVGQTSPAEDSSGLTDCLRERDLFWAQTREPPSGQPGTIWRSRGMLEETSPICESGIFPTRLPQE